MIFYLFDNFFNRRVTGSSRMVRCAARPSPSPTTWWYTCECTRTSDLSGAAFATKLSDKRLIYKGMKQHMESGSKLAIEQVPVAQILQLACLDGNGKGPPVGQPEV